MVWKVPMLIRSTGSIISLVRPVEPKAGKYVCVPITSMDPTNIKLIMNDSGSYPPTVCIRGMVQLKNGDWWFIIMQDRGPIGRVPHLVPVKWVDGWPMLGSGGKDIITYPKPEVGKTYPFSSPATTDEFNTSSLGLQWQWNHNPDNSRWS